MVDSGALLCQKAVVQQARAAGLAVLTYGLANNDPEWVKEQHALGVQAAIADNVAAVAAATVALRADSKPAGLCIMQEPAIA